MDRRTSTFISERVLFPFLLLLLLVKVNGVEGKVWRVDNLGNGTASSLRDHVENNAASGDTVWVDVAGSIILQTPIQIDAPITILGPSPTHLTLDGVGSTRIFEVNAAAGRTVIRGLRMVNGAPPSGEGGAVLHNSGRLELVNCVIEDCQAPLHGGGVFNNDSLAVVRSSILNCYASDDGGGIASDGINKVLVVNNSTLSMNRAGGTGGGIKTAGDSVEIHHSTIVYNSAGGDGGGWGSLSTNSSMTRTTHSIFEHNSNGFTGSPNIFSDAPIKAGFLLVPDSSGGQYDIIAPNYFDTTHTSGIPDSLNYTTSGHGYKYYPLPGPDTSDAVDAGANSSIAPWDQRYAPRNLDGTQDGNLVLDIGAVEYTPYQVEDPNGSLLGLTLDNVLDSISLNSPAPPHYIAFDMDTSMGTTISQSSSYQFSQRTLIDGWSQEGSRVPGPNDPGVPSDQVTPGRPIVEVDGNGLTIDGFEFSNGAEGSLVRGLSVFNRISSVGVRVRTDSVVVSGMHFGLDGDAAPAVPNEEDGVRITDAASWCRIGGLRHFQRNVMAEGHTSHINITGSAGVYNRILGNFLGPMANGAATSPNPAQQGLLIQGHRTIVGSSLLAGRNLIGGNAQRGIALQGSGGPSKGNLIRWNRIGTDHNGTSSIPNDNGILSEYASRTMIRNNQISGNNGHGILLQYSTDTTLILGNRIGLSSTDSSALGNAIGIRVRSIASNTLIGGSRFSDSSNVISGNNGYGIWVDGSGGPTAVLGNLIGTSADGMARVANGSHGVRLDTNVVVGLKRDVNGNIISGNDSSGIQVRGGMGDVTPIRGNYIGVDSTGQSPLPNWNNGIHLKNAGYQVMIGDTLPIFGNVIGGNERNGILIENPSGQGKHLVGNNFIGIDSTGTSPIGNAVAGVVVNSDSNYIGSPPSFGNHIAFNGGAGIRMDQGGGNVFSMNKVHDNGGLGIDLNADGVTPNDTGDADTGPNSLLNYPELIGVANCGGNLSVKYAFDSEDNGTFRVEFYRIPAGMGDPSGYGEGNEFLEADTVTLGTTPPADTFTHTFTASTLSAGDSVSALAIHMNGRNSSEFSANVPVSDSLNLVQDSIEHVQCSGGGSGGTFYFSIIGGSAPYELNLYDSAFVTHLQYSSSVDTNSWSYSNLLGGTYNVEVISSLGCADTINFTIDQPDSMDIQVFAEQESCDGLCDGKLYADVSGGTSPYTFKWDSLGTGDTIVADTVANACPGGYDLEVVDSNGCSKVDTTGYVAPGDSLGLTTNNDTVICEGDSAQLSASANATDHVWTPSNGLSDDSIADPLASPDTSTTYFIEASIDSSGCTRTDTVSVFVNPAPVPMASPDTNICQGDSVGLNSVGGMMSYDWSPGSDISDSSAQDPDVYPDISTQYILEVIDSNGCSGMDTVQVQVDPIPGADAGADTLLCNGDTLSLGGSPTSANSNASYSWSPSTTLLDSGVASPSAYPSDTTEYVVTVMDTLSGCSNTDSVLVDVVPGVSAFAGTDTTICEGDTIQLNASAAGGTAGYNFQWPAGAYLDNAFISDPMASAPDTTDFIVEVSDANNCSDQDTVTLNVLPSLNLQVSGNDTVCEGMPTTLKGSGADEYDWGSTVADSITIFPGSDTTVSLIGTDTATGCSSDTLVDITVHPMPELTIDTLRGLPELCQGDTLELIATDPDQHMWSNGDLGDTLLVAPDSSGYYWGTAFDPATGCADQDSVYVTVSSTPPAPSSSQTYHELCSDDPVPVLGVDSNSAYSNRWYADEALTDTVGSGDTLSSPVLNTDTNLFYAAFDTTGGCQGASTLFTVILFDSNAVELSEDTAICSGETAPLKVSGASSYEWSPSEDLNDPTASAPIASPQASTSYIVIAENSSGCIVKDSVRVEVLSAEECEMEVYNAFSPDNDGVNDEWIIDGIDAFPDNSVVIFNRWGDEVKRFEGYDNDEVVWDGRSAEGQMLPAGTYYYVIRLKGDEEEKLNGYVQITK